MKRKKPNLLLFSNETLFEIFDNLDDKSLLNLSETCSSLRKLVERNWKIHGYNKLLQIVCPISTYLINFIIIYLYSLNQR